MATNQLKLTAGLKTGAINNRILGLPAIIGAPMLLLQFLLGTRGINSEGGEKNALIALLGVLYIGGWMCGAIGMFRLRTYGESRGSKIVFVQQMILLSLALMFSVFETFGATYENGGVLFAVFDAGYPLSHLFMIVVGIFVWRAGVWRGFSKFAPLLVGIALPLTLGLMPLLGEKVGVVSFGALTATGLGIIGWQLTKKAD
jgi:hypothetical protein